MKLRSDAEGQFGIVGIILLIVALVMFYVGVTTASSGCVGTGLMWIGGSFIFGGFGGYLEIRHPYVLVSGGAGFVVVLVGAAARIFLTC